MWEAFHAAILAALQEDRLSFHLRIVDDSEADYAGEGASTFPGGLTNVKELSTEGDDGSARLQSGSIAGIVIGVVALVGTLTMLLTSHGKRNTRFKAWGRIENGALGSVDDGVFSHNSNQGWSVNGSKIWLSSRYLDLITREHKKEKKREKSDVKPSDAPSSRGTAVQGLTFRPSDRCVHSVNDGRIALYGSDVCSEEGEGSWMDDEASPKKIEATYSRDKGLQLEEEAGYSTPITSKIQVLTAHDVAAPDDRHDFAAGLAGLGEIDTSFQDLNFFSLDVTSVRSGSGSNSVHEIDDFTSMSDGSYLATSLVEKHTYDRSLQTSIGLTKPKEDEIVPQSKSPECENEERVVLSSAAAQSSMRTIKLEGEDEDGSQDWVGFGPLLQISASSSVSSGSFMSPTLGPLVLSGSQGFYEHRALHLASGEGTAEASSLQHRQNTDTSISDLSDSAEYDSDSSYSVEEFDVKINKQDSNSDTPGEAHFFGAVHVKESTPWQPFANTSTVAVSEGNGQTWAGVISHQSMQPSDPPGDWTQLDSSRRHDAAEQERLFMGKDEIQLTQGFSDEESSSLDQTFNGSGRIGIAPASKLSVSGSQDKAESLLSEPDSTINGSNSCGRIGIGPSPICSKNSPTIRLDETKGNGDGVKAWIGILPAQQSQPCSTSSSDALFSFDNGSHPGNQRVLSKKTDQNEELGFRGMRGQGTSEYEVQDHNDNSILIADNHLGSFRAPKEANADHLKENSILRRKLEELIAFF